MSTPVAICSNALLMLGDKPLSSFSEPTERARLASNLYPQVRDAILRSHPWNCAVKRVVLAPEATAPAFDYAFSFALPSDWLRNLQVGQYGREVDFKTEGRKILADENPLYLRYIYRNDVEATWDAMLIHGATLAMAAAMAYAVTKSASVRDSQLAELTGYLKQCRAVDGQDDPGETLGDFVLLSSRATSRIG